MSLTQLRKLYVDCSTLAGQLACSTNGGRSVPMRGQYDAIRAYAFRECSTGVRDINEQTIGAWRAEFAGEQP